MKSVTIETLGGKVEHVRIYRDRPTAIEAAIRLACENATDTDRYDIATTVQTHAAYYEGDWSVTVHDAIETDL